MTRRARQASQICESNGACLAPAHQPQRPEWPQTTHPTPLAKRRGPLRFAPLNLRASCPHPQCAHSPARGGDGGRQGLPQHVHRRPSKEKGKLFQPTDQKGQIAYEEVSSPQPAPPPTGSLIQATFDVWDASEGKRSSLCA